MPAEAAGVVSLMTEVPLLIACVADAGAVMLLIELDMLLMTDEIDDSVELSPSVGTIVVESAGPVALGIVASTDDTDATAVVGSAFQENGLSADGVLNAEL